MIHARSDYDRIQDPAVHDPSILSEGSTPIGEDEPVFLLRAKDRFAPTVALFWAALLRSNGGSEDTAAAVERWADTMTEWQERNGCKLPDAPAYALKR